MVGLPGRGWRATGMNEGRQDGADNGKHAVMTFGSGGAFDTPAWLAKTLVLLLWKQSGPTLVARWTTMVRDGNHLQPMDPRELSLRGVTAAVQPQCARTGLRTG